MTSNRIFEVGAIYRPADLAFLKGVFDDARRSVSLEQMSSEAIATRLFHLFQDGMRDRDLMLSVLRIPDRSRQDAETQAKVAA